MSGFGVDFGQKVDLTASIRNILRNYPEGTAVLKELVQNADDAGASTVVFYLDHRCHSSTKLADPSLASFQGPSLLVYNNAVFTPEDFQSIQRIGDSLKKSSEDSRAKIGRFGIGFNAVYHWTELPSFVSSNYLVMLDPQARFLPNVNPSNPGKMVDFIGNPSIVAQYPDQFKPYEIDGLKWNKTFNGTLFRLPLRTTEQAKTSLLSKRALSVKEATELLQALRVEASAMLLFLKSVTKIEIREWHEGAVESRVLFSCQATNASADVMRKRCLVSDKAALQQAASSVEYAAPADYTLLVQCTANASVDTATAAVARPGTAPAESYTEQWEVCNQLGGRAANQIASHADHALLRLIPWAGVAACVAVTKADGTAVTGRTAARDGLAYCFLPLPVRTGLPIMVNGFFELSSNRRDVWQAGADMTGDGRTRAQWNIALMRDLIAPCYARLLVRLRDTLGYCAAYQALWPNIRATSAPWDEVVRSTLALSRTTKLLKVATPADLAPSDTVSTTGAAAAGASSGKANMSASLFGKAGATTVADLTGWISCAEAVLLPLGYTLAQESAATATAVVTSPAPSKGKEGGHSAAHGTSSGGSTAVAHAQDAADLTGYLVRAKAALVLCTEALKITLLETGTCTQTATPGFVRTTLRSGTQVANNVRKIVAAHTIPLPEMCKFLLKYCFSDLAFGTATTLSAATATALDGLPLLPMSDGTVSFLRIFSASQLTAIAEVNSMGFSLSTAVCALNLTAFSSAAACELLATDPGRVNAALSDHNHCIHLLLDEPQLAVFHQAAPVLLNRAHIAPNEVDILSHAAVTKASNIRTFHPQFVPDLLRFILPPECFSGAKTMRTQLKAGAWEAAIAFLRVFWKYASTRGEVISAVKEGCNLVPVQGQEALFPLSRLSNLLVRSKGDVVLPEGLVEVLQLLGVQIVDPTILSENGMMPAVFWEYVLSPTRSGVIAAIDAVLRAAAAAAKGGSAAQDPFAPLSCAQRDVLRQYMSTVEAVRNLTDKEGTILRAMPIFASFKAVPTGAALTSAYVAIGDRITRPASTSATSPGTPAPYATVADFKHLPATIMPEHMLQLSASHDLALLTQLHVTVLTRTQYFRTEFLPAVQALYRAHPVDTIATLLHMLGEVKTLSESDRSFQSMLATVAFIPSATAPRTAAAAGTSSDSAIVVARGPLRKASELFDPTNAELVALLDPQFFPDTTLFPLLDRPELLALLRTIGLHTTLNWPSIVACARSIADMSDVVIIPVANPAAASATAASGATAPQAAAQVNANKITRAASLLRFLDKNITRLTHTEKERPAAERRASAGPSIFSFSTLFGGAAASGTPDTKANGKKNEALGNHEQEPDEQSMEACMEQLKLIAWVPVLAAAPHECMPWPQPRGKSAVLSVTAAPVDTAPVADGWMVSATKRLVDEPVHTPALQRLLCWQEPVAVQVIAIQLRELSARYLQLYAPLTQDCSATGNSATSNDGQAVQHRQQLQRLRETITGLIPQLYQRLNRAAAEGVTATIQAITTILETSAWIWVGDSFVTIDRVALNAGVNAAPYLYQLPQDLQVYTALLQVFQVKSRFNNRDYIEALRQMAVESGALATTSTSATATTSSASVTANASRPLSDARLDVCISLATLLATESSASSSLHTASQAIYLPDNQGRLALSDVLINDDVPWLSGPEYISVRAGCRLIHPNISSRVATTLGVKSLRLSLLNRSLEQSLFTLPTEATVESFGQAESLTNRLKTILDMYPDGNPIFSELVQNADDAGATVVSILLDENSYECESLLDSKMAALQGPSLLVRNDAVFTEADFRSLAKIGQGSKLDKLATTGRFGLGFNSTYHLTDTPSFVSGDHLVIFDPHCGYVPGATVNQPGVRIRFSGSDLGATFRNQFEPFQYFGCDVHAKYAGTLFRFPLRTAVQARKSEISKRSYTVEDMGQNLQQLAGQLSNMLLFLRNVRRIEILRCDAGSRAPVLLHCARSTVSGVEKVSDQSLLTYFDKNEGNNGSTALSRDGFYKRLLSTSEAALPKVFSQVHIESESYEPIVSTATVGGDSAVDSARTGLVAPHRTSANDTVVVTSHTEVDYFVAAGLCGGEARRMACSEALRHFKLVPMGAVAACIGRSGSTGEPASPTVDAALYPRLQGVAFCYLPLPVLTQLPVHCNAYFELSSNRRDIWKGDDTKGEAKLRSDWNICVMRDVLAPLYANLMVKLHARAQTAAKSALGAVQQSLEQVQAQQLALHYKLLSLLPCPLPHDPWNNVASALFTSLQNERLLFSTIGGGSFVSLQQAYVMERTSPTDTDIHGDRLEGLLLQENLAVVRVPGVVLKALVASTAVAGEVSPTFVRSLFHRSKVHTHPTLGVTNKPPAQALQHRLGDRELDNAVFWLQYCLRDFQAPGGGAITTSALEQLHQLIGLHLLPLENDTLGTFEAATDAPPFFLVNDTERRLLSRAGKQIVASETLLGQHVYNILKQEAFSQVCNVKPITAVDTLKLITTILPSEWMAASTICANRLALTPATGGGMVDGMGRERETSVVVTMEPASQRLILRGLLGTGFCVNRVTPLSDTGVDVTAHSAARTTATTPAAPAVAAEPTLIVTNEWLYSLWSYITENKCVAMFRDIFPILPVVYPNTLPEGQYLVKVSASVPVLHMTYREIPADTVGILAQLGVFVFDPSVLGGKSYSADVVELLVPPNARGVLAVLCQRMQILQSSGSDLQAMLNPDDAARLAMQAFVLDSVVSKIDNLTGAEIGMLCALPIWATYGGRSGKTYGPLQTETVKLPPAGASAEDRASLLDGNFVCLRSERDRSLYLRLGVREPSMGQFYANHLVPRFQAGTLPAAEVEALMLPILRNLPQLEKESPGLTELLSTCAVVRCEGESNNALQPPTALYDPQVPLLSSFMPVELFPSSTVYRDPALMHSLRLLGLRTKVTAQGVLTAAKAIETEYDRFRQRSAPSEDAGFLTVRGQGLMTYLETHIEKILQEESPATLQAFTQERERSQQPTQDGSSAPVTGTGPSPQGGAWGATLRATKWVPVYVRPPSREVHADLALPWPTQIHSTPVASPSQCVSGEKLWLCSASHRICAVDTSKAELLQHVLGWDKPIAGRSLAAQLLALRTTHDAAVAQVSFSAHSANEVYSAVVPTLLHQLQQAFNRESSEVIKPWAEALRGKAIVWMQSRFIETTRLAFTPLPGVDTEPFLFVVRPELMAYKKLLRVLGARESFEAADLAALTRDLYASHRDAPLSAYKTTLCIGIVQLLHRLISGEDLSVDNSPAAAAGAESPGLPVAVAIDADGFASPTASDGKSDNATKVEPKPTEKKKVTLAELGPLYLPDETQVLKLATTLTYDDAPWMSAPYHQQFSAATAGSPPTQAGSIRFVHNRIDVPVAMALGCKSLRGQLFTGEDVHCPDAQVLQKVLNDDSLRDTLMDLLYVADACGSAKLHLLFDGRTHPKESLLHPGLAEAQGPALVAYLEGSAQVDREAMSLLLSLQSLNTDVLAAMEPTSPTGSANSANAAVSGIRERFRRATGKKLLTTFAVTDCLQVLSGNEFFVFDPCGKYLHSDTVSNTTVDGANKAGTPERGLKRLPSKLQRKSMADIATSAAVGASNERALPCTPRAQHYFINKGARGDGTGSGSDNSNGGNALQRFPDQFASFLSLPFALSEQLRRSGKVNGVVLRMPLRKAQSPISPNVTTIDDVKVHLGCLRSTASAALVFADKLMEVSLSHIDGAAEMISGSGEKGGTDGDPSAAHPRATSVSTFDLSVKLVSPPATRRSRQGLTTDKGWNKHFLTKFFSKAYSPQEAMYPVTLETTMRCKDVWVVPTPQLLSLMTLLVSQTTISTSDIKSHREDWLVAAICGYGKLRDLAMSDPYSALDLHPFVTIVAPILDPALLMDITVPPDAGMYFSGAAAVGTTGLPFHIEGSFLQRHEPLPVPLVRAPSNGAKGVQFSMEQASPPTPMRRDSSVTFVAGDTAACQAWCEALFFTAIDVLYPKVLFEIKTRIETVAKHLTANAAAQPSGGSAARKLRLQSGFYKYFPYTPRTSAVALRVLSSTALWTTIVENPVFLQQNGFHYLRESILPTKLLPAEVQAYILPVLPLVFCPQQLTADLTAAKVGHVSSLSPAKLRQTLAANALMHSSRLTNNGRLVRALLQYCLTDLAEKSVGEGEFTQRKLYREMAGVPLMPVATLNAKTFPRSAAEQVAMAPLIIHALLPGLKSMLLHPTLLHGIPLFSDPLFLDTLFITPFNATYLERNIGSVLPTSWRSVPATEWVENHGGGEAVGSAGRMVRAAAAAGGGNAGATNAPPSQVLMYTLWNTILWTETSWTEIDRLRDYPLIPVVSRGRRLLLSMALLSVVFSVQSTEEQDQQRIFLKREVGRMTALANSAIDAAPESATAEEVADEWAWTSQPLSTGGTKTRAVTRPGRNNAQASSGQDSDDDLGDAVITDLDFPSDTGGLTPPPAAGAGAGTSAAVPPGPVAMNRSAAGDSPLPVPPPAGPTGAVAMPPPAPSAAQLVAVPPAANILRILRTLGVPFLDTAIFESVPQIISRSDGNGGNTCATDFGGRRILQCLHRLETANVLIASHPAGNEAATEAATTPPTPLLHYGDLSVSDRNTLLLLMSNQQLQHMSPLSAAEQQQLKQLRLFTSKADGAAVSIAECRSGVYWCREESVLATVRGRTEQDTPVILIYDATLRDLYQLLGVEELTAATAVRKFTVPQLRTMPALQRLRVMMDLAQHWDSYRSDDALVAQLKEVPFVPLHNVSTETVHVSANAAAPHATETIESCEGMDVSQLRLAKDVFLWTNEELLIALRGSKQGQYFPPSYLRTPAMKAMCEDLGMQKELTEATFKQIALDIESTLSQAYATHHDAETQLDALREAAERGRGILRYVKANDRITLLLQNKTYATSIGKIRFVPMKVPTATESGGYVSYRDEVGRFDALLARTHGQLAFTVLPIIDEDLAPPQYYYSSLGITSTPSTEVVLRHVRNLTSQGESLDRWNAPYEITKTFSAIFQFLQDNWKTLSPNVKSSLSTINLVPVGNLLIKPTRLFFRLSEDLSPFMHEIPRLFGAHEAFLKQVGIKESPSVTDYVRFLGDLAHECGECYLNPNELRAVVAILQVIAVQSGESAEASEVSSTTTTATDSPNNKMTAMEVKSTARLADLTQLFVPDERSVLRPIAQCLVNDNEWFRGSAGVQQQLDKVGLFILHPSIAASTAAQLLVERLSSVVREELVQTPEAGPHPDEAALRQQYQAALTAPAFVTALSTLMRSKASSDNDTQAAHSRAPATLTALLQGLECKFVRSLQTRFRLAFPGAPAHIAGEGSAAGERLAYLQQASGSTSGGLFVNLGMTGPPLSVNLAVAVGVCQRIGADLSLAHAIAALLDAHDVSRMQLVLGSMQVHLDDENRNGSSDAARHSAHHTRGVPGEPVSAQDSALLELRPLRVFRVGEVVAVEDGAPSDAEPADGAETAAGRDSSVPVSGVKAGAADHVPTAAPAARASGLKKVYAKVVSVGAPADEGLRRITIRTGSGVRTVLSTDVFTFRSARESNTAKAASSALKTPVKPLFSFGRSKPVPATASAGPGTGTIQVGGAGGDVQTAGESAEAAEISRAELMGAVNGLLARAGVPMQMDQQLMVSHILELESTKKRLEKELANERQQLLQAKDQLEASANMLKCPICITNDVYFVLTPCGHTICESCIDMWRGSGCPTCRTRMTAKVRLFLPGSSGSNA